MSDEPAAILATYSDYRRLPARKVLRVSFEVPLEQEAEVFGRLGYPGVHDAVWCAIARTIPPQQRKEPPPKPSPAVRDAGVACKDPDFWAFLSHYTTFRYGSEKEAAEFVRRWCNVDSRREIKPGSNAERLWNRLMVDFMAWWNRERRDAVCPIAALKEVNHEV